MAIEFDFDGPPVPDDVVRSVAAEMSGGGLKPLTAQEVLERQEWLAEHRARIELERLNAQRREREAEAVAQHERAVAAAKEREALQRQRAIETDRLTRQRQMANLQLSAAKQEAWRTNVQQQMMQERRQQYTNSLMSKLEGAINEPKPPPDDFATLYRQNQRSGLYYDDDLDE